MPEPLTPGVYLEDDSLRPRSIEGVSTHTTGFVGASRFGAVDLEPEIVTSLVEFERVYGDRQQLEFAGRDASHNYLWHAARAFFEEGGKRLYVARIFRPLVTDDAGSVETPYTRPGGNIDDDNSGAPDTHHCDGHARGWLPNEPGQETRDNYVLVRSRFPGAAGNVRARLTLRLSENLLDGIFGSLTVESLRDYDTVWFGDATSPTDNACGGDGDSFRVARFDEDEQTWVFSQTGTKTDNDYRLNSATAANVLDPARGQEVRRATLALTVISADGDSHQVWDDIAPDPNHADASGAPDSLFSRFAPNPDSLSQARTLPLVVLAGSALDTGVKLLNTLISYGAASGSNTSLAANLNNRDSSDDERSVEILLSGGNDGQLPGAREYEGYVNPGTNAKCGLAALENVEDISIVAAPGSTAGYASNSAEANAVAAALVAHAERLRYRIALIDSGDAQSISEVRAMRARIDSGYAAFYYPWVRVLDPLTGSEINLPPSGFVAGIYARNDTQRGVYKAPANEIVNLAVGFETTLNRAQQEALNPEGINCFRFFEGRGFRLWGARTASSDPEWKYVNLRRYSAYLERSIDRGTQWTVFEPNNDTLWNTVRRSVENFLLREWQAGALLGDKPEKAYFVRCDRSTMTQADLDNGRLVCVVGTAPLRPAEFVIIRIGQWTADCKDC
jgi:phage tail sheath protein FI